jgi:hypothetical protein
MWGRDQLVSFLIQAWLSLISKTLVHTTLPLLLRRSVKRVLLFKITYIVKSFRRIIQENICIWEVEVQYINVNLETAKILFYDSKI